MATNEELVAEIQTGNHEKMEELWIQMKGYIHAMAAPVIRAVESSPVFDVDDLMQVGYLALEKAAASYDLAAEYKFSTHLKYVLRTALADATGYRTPAQRKDPTRHAVSLDALHKNAAGDEYSLLEALEDPVDLIQGIEDQLDDERKKQAIHERVAQLPEKQKVIIQRHYFGGESQEAIAGDLGVSNRRVSQIERQALKRLRNDPVLREIEGYVDDHTNFYFGLGANAQLIWGLSTVEAIVVRREEMRERMAAKLRTEKTGDHPKMSDPPPKK